MELRIFGRSSSHFTRVTRLFAHELGLATAFTPIGDLTSRDPALYGGNPALKLPLLRHGDSTLFGTENICRYLAELAPGRRIVWPEDLRAPLSRNAQELVMHGMAAEVQLVFGLIACELPADNVYFAKAREGFTGALGWLDEHLAAALAALPAPRDLSLFEVTLFCLVEHIAFRGTLPLDPYPALRGFAREYGAREAAVHTRYHFD